MSLINETLHNLNNQKDDSDFVINPARESRHRHDFKGGKSKNNFLILFISFFIIVTMFILTYRIQVNDYFKAVKSYFVDKVSSFNLHSSEVKVDDRAVVAIPKDIKVNEKKSDGMVSPGTQIRYYHALDLLNEGEAEQALQDLAAILEENPGFAPAKQAINMLKNSR